VKLFGDHNGIFAEVMQEFGKTGRFNYRTLRHCHHAFVSLIAGASLAPKPLADACGGMGTLLADRLKLDDRGRGRWLFRRQRMLAAFITSPFSGALLGLESAQGGSGVS